MEQVRTSSSRVPYSLTYMTRPPGGGPSTGRYAPYARVGGKVFRAGARHIGKGAGALAAGLAALVKRRKPNQKVLPVPRRPIEQKAIQDGPGGSSSRFHHGKRQLTLPRSVLANMTKNHVLTNSVGQITSVIGKQNIFSTDSLFTSTDILTFAGITGGTNGRVICLDAALTLMITNAANTTAIIDIYDVIARRDVSNATIPNMAQSWIQGDLDEGGAAGSYLVPGVTPFSSKSFTQMAVIKKKTHVILAQGETHTHKVFWAPNKAMDYGLVKYGTFFKDLTCEQFVVVHGQLDDAVTGGGAGTVSLSATKLNYMSTKEYNSSWIGDNTSNFAATNSLPTGAFTGGENLMDIGTGAATTYATA